MECPHCGKKVGVLSKALNKMDKVKVCPHCSEEIKPFIDIKVAGMLLIPGVILALLVFKPLLLKVGITGSITTGLVTGAILVLSMHLKKPE